MPNFDPTMIFVVEDEEDIRELVIYHIENEGYSAFGFPDGKSMLKKLEKERQREQPVNPELIILDLMMPGMSGLDVCRRLKKDVDWQTIPILMLTACSDESDVVLGLELGADDYITKPFSQRILNARIRALLRRSRLQSHHLSKSNLNTEDTQNFQAGNANKKIEIEDIVIDFNRFIVRKGGTKLNLTKSEFEILSLLVQKPGWVYSRKQIINQIKGDDYPVTERSIDVQITGLRKKINDDGTLIQTARGLGYKFKGEDD